MPVVVNPTDDQLKLAQIDEKHTFHGQISATMVLKIPIFPFPAPARARTVSAIGRLVEKPHTTLVTRVLKTPSSRIGFLPNRSEALPHGIAAMH